MSETVEELKKYLDKTGLSQLWSLIKQYFALKNSIPTGALASLDEVGQEQLSEALLSIINGKANSATTLSGYGITDAYTKTQVDNAIAASASKVYKFQGSVAFSNIPTSGMKEGDTYNITDDFTTTDAFLEGAGKECKSGTNISYTENGWDVLAGIYDFSDFMMKSDLVELTAEEIDQICTID